MRFDLDSTRLHSTEAQTDLRTQTLVGLLEKKHFQGEMMDEMEIARHYYFLIADSRPDKRAEAQNALSSVRSEEVASLARIGRKVFDVTVGLAPASDLEATLREFDSFPPTSEWSRIMETTGQQLIGTSNANTALDGPEREEIGGHALRFLSRAQDGGFPLSDYTIRMLEEVREQGGNNAMLAAELVRINEMLAPGRSRAPLRSPR